MNHSKQIEIRVLIERLLGMAENSVRPSDQSQPMEGENYATMQVSEVNTLGWSGNNANSKEMKIYNLTLDFMGPLAVDYANDIDMAMKSRYAVDTLISMDMGFIECNSPRNLTALEMDRISRYQIKIQLSHAVGYKVSSTIPNEYQNDSNINEVPLGLFIEP